MTQETNLPRALAVWKERAECAEADLLTMEQRNATARNHLAAETVRREAAEAEAAEWREAVLQRDAALHRETLQREADVARACESKDHWAKEALIAQRDVARLREALRRLLDVAWSYAEVRMSPVLNNAAAVLAATEPKP